MAAERAAREARAQAANAARAANRARAPICAAFVEDMRAEFGPDVAVTYVSEGDITIGKLDNRPAVDSGDVTVYHADGSQRAVARWTHLQLYARAHDAQEAA